MKDGNFKVAEKSYDKPATHTHQRLVHDTAYDHNVLPMNNVQLVRDEAACHCACMHGGYSWHPTFQEGDKVNFSTRHSAKRRRMAKKRIKKKQKWQMAIGR